MGMHDLFGFGTVARALSYLYWVLAIGALAVAMYQGKDRRRKIIGAMIVIALFGFLPGKALLERHQSDAYAKEAWAYFKKKCAEEAGEKIYKTFKGVKSVVVIKPLPPATEKDLFDQFWYGDPYSNATPWNERGVQAAKNLVSYSRKPDGSIQKGLEFVEIKDHSVDRYLRFSRPRSYNEEPGKEFIASPVSRLALSWDDISTPEDRRYWVAGSRLRIVDLTNGSVVAERIGYLIESGFGSTEGGRRPWLTSRGPFTSCPALIGMAYSDAWFVSNAIGSTKE